MTRLVALTAAVALAFALPAAAARPFEPVTIHPGVYVVTYWTALDMDARQVTADQYAAFVASGSCGPRSHVSTWPIRGAKPGQPVAELQLVCEL